MWNYPSVVATPIDFTVTVLGNVVPVITNVVYYVGQSRFTFTVDKFKVLPENYNTGKRTLEAYLLNSTDIQLPS